LLQEHVKLLALFQQAGEVIGRKKLQKMIFIAKKMDVPFSERFKFHMFGPYSEELTLRIEELCHLQFLQEVKEDKGGYSQYRYTLTDEGEKFLSLYSLDMPRLSELVSKMNGESSRFLELVSTLLYFDELAKEEAIEKVHIVKPKQNFTEAEIANAYQFIDEMMALTAN